MAVDSLGNPRRIQLTAGQVADISQAPALVEGLEFDALLADKGYDSDAFVETVTSRRTASGEPVEAVIPPRRNRKTPRAYDTHLDKERNLVERFIGRVKHFRRVATRYEKTARNYLAFWHIASTLVLLR